MITAANFDLSNGSNLLRILVGLYFLPHVVNMIRNRAAVVDFFDKAGIRPAAFCVGLAILVEAGSGAALVLGLYTPYAALLAAALLLVAAYAVFRLQGFKWLWISGGFEFPVFWSITCIAVAVLNAKGFA